MDYSKGLEYRETDGYALLAQLVEHGIRNAGVRCSSHLEGTIFPKKNRLKSRFVFLHREVQTNLHQVGGIFFRTLRRIVTD